LERDVYQRIEWGNWVIVAIVAWGYTMKAKENKVTTLNLEHTMMGFGNKSLQSWRWWTTMSWKRRSVQVVVLLKVAQMLEIRLYNVQQTKQRSG
jgi:hypothetical protein